MIDVVEDVMVPQGPDLAPIVTTSSQTKGTP